MSDKIRFMSLGDIHLGHPTTPTRHIIKNLDRYITSRHTLKDIDVLVITGDVFDRLLTNADPNLYLIQNWITRLLINCSVEDVTVVVLEGTPLHDWEQSRFFIEQTKNMHIKLDIHYATTLSIGYLERFGISVLYVPDKCRPTTEIILDDVRKLLKEHNLSQVDYAVMHGSFEYQMPEIADSQKHCSETYLGLVKHLIFIGHIHNMSVKERILAAGSFDRGSQGEEAPKGYFKVIADNRKKEYDIVFCENEHAKKYITIPCHEMVIEDVRELVAKRIVDLPKESAIRLRCNKFDPAVGSLPDFRVMYPDFSWDVKKEDEKKEKKKQMADVFNETDLASFVDITKVNISSLLEEELIRQGFGEEVIGESLKLLEQFK